MDKIKIITPITKIILGVSKKKANKFHMKNDTKYIIVAWHIVKESILYYTTCMCERIQNNNDNKYVIVIINNQQQQKQKSKTQNFSHYWPYLLIDINHQIYILYMFYIYVYW